MNTQALAVLISGKIQLVRDQRVMLDADLAELYQVPTKVLVQAVKRNVARFPEDFMFQLSTIEFANLRSQSVTSSWGGRRSAPYFFTEQGVAMLSSVIGSPHAIAINIEIMRTFILVRQMAATHQDLAERLEELEAKTEQQALQFDAFTNITRKQIRDVFEALRQLTTPIDPPKQPIGFVYPEKSRKTNVKLNKN